MVELESGDLPQASEKLWGASAQALKSLAERRGWRHGSHSEFYKIMRRIRDEVADPDLMNRNFDTANHLHVNFYENRLDEVDVRMRAKDVRDFIDTLSRM